MNNLQCWRKKGKNIKHRTNKNELYLWNRIINERAGDLLRENGMALPQVWNLHHFQSFIPISICAGTDLVGGLKNKQKQKSLISIPTCAGTDPVGGLQPVWGVPHGSGAWNERLWFFAFLFFRDERLCFLLFVFLEVTGFGVFRDERQRFCVFCFLFF